jgi:BolA protein
MKVEDSRVSWIRETLRASLQPSFIEVIDQGWQHIGHVEEGAGHFLVRIASPQFENLSLVESHRLIYQALGDAVGSKIHALAIEIQS